MSEPALLRARASLHAVLALSLAVLFATACGGGDGGDEATGPIELSLGTLPSIKPTVVTQSFQSPLGGPGSVNVVGQVGPFSIAPGFLPAPIDASGGVSLPVVFSPTATGAAQGTISLAFDAAGTVRIQQYRFSAEAEPATWTTTPFPVVFGIVPANTTVDQDIRLENTSTVNVLELTTATLPNATLSILASPFPLTLQPGTGVTFTLRYSPVDDGDNSGALVIGEDDPGGPISIPVLAGVDGAGREDVTDYGDQPLNAMDMTAQLTVSVPSDAVSLTLEASGLGTDELGLGELIGPNGRVFENTQLTGNYVWVPTEEIFATTVPNSDRANVQLDGPGDYVFRMVKLNGPSASIQVRAIVERRANGFETIASLPLNIWLADGLSVDAASAPTDATLQNTLTRMGSLLAQQGIRLGDIDYYDVTDGDFDAVTSDAEFQALLRLSASAAEDRLNLFFVEVALGGGIVGVSATISGPKTRGTSLSGVMSIYANSSDFVGFVAAHEIGHFCGLFHTVEENGDLDFIDDTAACPPDGSTNDACAAPGGGYLMHWQALEGEILTNGQGAVLRGHPLMEPADVGGSPKMRRPPPPMDAEARARLAALTSQWCGTCRHRPQRKPNR